LEGAYSVRAGTSTGAQVLPLLAAQGGFVEFQPNEAGHYAFVDHAMSLAEKGAHGMLEVTP
jgi:nitrite reductase (NO-forming)